MSDSHCELTNLSNSKQDSCKRKTKNQSFIREKSIFNPFNIRNFVQQNNCKTMLSQNVHEMLIEKFESSLPDTSRAVHFLFSTNFPIFHFTNFLK